ncbi:MAG: amino acid permease [Hyphomicrobiaceae bacterium]|nr:amino acid permease [Hyphomicrobiaceae bacterium]
MTDASVPPSPKLRRALGLPLLTLYGLGVTVGAGIYVLVGATAAKAGIYAPVSFVLAAITVAFTGLTYSELATRFPVSAGEAAYVDAGFRWPPLSLVVGLLVALSGVVSAAAVTIGAAAYLVAFIELPLPLVTIAIVVLMGLIAFWGIAQSVFLAALITVVELGGLAFVILWGFATAQPTGADLLRLLPPLEPGPWLGIGAASLLAFFAFVGFEDMANVAEEVRDPARTMPRAVLLTLALSTLLYVLATVAVILSVPLDQLSGSDAPLILVFSGASQWVRDLFALIAVVATINGILAQIIMASRVVYGLAERGQLPRVLAAVSPRTQTPGPATALIVLAIILLTQTLPIGALAEHTSQIVLTVFVLVNLALIRIKGAEHAKTGDGFRVPVAIPVLGVVTGLLLLASTVL